MEQRATVTRYPARQASLAQRVGFLTLGPLVAALLLAGCSGSADLADGPVGDDNSAEDGANGDSGIDGQAGSQGAGDGDGDGELGFSDPDGNDAGADPGSESIGPDNLEDVTRDPLPEVAAPELAEPEDVLPGLKDEVGDAVEQAAESPDVAILDVAKLPDLAPTDEEIAAFGDGHPRTSTGRLIVLDELASLACANVEIALGAIDDGLTAVAQDHVASASQRAGQSEVESIEGWSDALDEAGSGASIDATTLVGFLSVCLEGGYVI